MAVFQHRKCNYMYHHWGCSALVLSLQIPGHYPNRPDIVEVPFREHFTAVGKFCTGIGGEGGGKYILPKVQPTRDLKG